MIPTARLREKTFQVCTAGVNRRVARLARDPPITADTRAAGSDPTVHWCTYRERETFSISRFTPSSGDLFHSCKTWPRNLAFVFTRVVKVGSENIIAKSGSRFAPPSPEKRVKEKKKKGSPRLLKLILPRSFNWRRVDSLFLITRKLRRQVVRSLARDTAAVVLFPRGRFLPGSLRRREYFPCLLFFLRHLPTFYPPTTL